MFCLLILVLIGIALRGICDEDKGAQKETIVENESKRITLRTFSANKIVIGVLNIDTSGIVEDPYEQKRALIRELRSNTRLKPVDVPETSSLSDLKKDNYKQAEKYRTKYNLDMLLHVSQVGSTYYFSLIDLYRKKVKEVSIDTEGVPVELKFVRISNKLLVNQYLNRVLREKREVLGTKEEIISQEIIIEGPKEMENFLLQNGPKLIAEGQYNRVLDLIEELPVKTRRHIQIRTLECFANLKGWVSDRDRFCKMNWWALRQKLISLGDNEATPMLIIFLKDEDFLLRKYAAELLGHIGDERALEDLREVGRNDENHRVRRYARWAYEQISGEKF